MMSGDSFWDQWAGQLVLQSPAYAVIGCAFLLAAIRRRRHPTASLLLMLSLALMMVETVGVYIFYGWLTSDLIASGGSASDVMGWQGVAQLVQGTMTAVSYALIFAAVFVDRTRPYESPHDPPQPGTEPAQPR